MIDLEQARRFYAEEVAAVANLHSPRLIEALAHVHREEFLGPGPWQIVLPEAFTSGKPAYRLTPDANPRHLYHNVLVALDPTRNLNNGQPSALAGWIETLDVREGETVYHLGCGVGYYTAIMAEVVGPGGRVVAIDADENLAARAARALAPWPHVTATHADGIVFDPGPFDAALVNAGATHLVPIWLERLRPGGRLLVPLTVSLDPSSPMGQGFTLLVEHRGAGYAARFVGPVGIFPCLGARDERSEARLRDVLMKGGWRRVQSLRRDPHDVVDSCLAHGVDSCLSAAPVQT